MAGYAARVAVALVMVGMLLVSGCNKAPLKKDVKPSNSSKKTPVVSEKSPVVPEKGEEKPPADHSEHKDHEAQKLGQDPK